MYVESWGSFPSKERKSERPFAFRLKQDEEGFHAPLAVSTLVCWHCLVPSPCTHPSALSQLLRNNFCPASNHGRAGKSPSSATPGVPASVVTEQQR